MGLTSGSKLRGLFPGRTTKNPGATGTIKKDCGGKASAAAQSDDGHGQGTPTKTKATQAKVRKSRESPLLRTSQPLPSTTPRTRRPATIPVGIKGYPGCDMAIAFTGSSGLFSRTGTPVFTPGPTSSSSAFAYSLQ